MATAKTISEKKKEKIVKNKSFYLQKFKLNASLKEHVAGAIISLKCHKSTKKPVEGFWRRRFNESAMDNCMEIYVEPKPAKQDKPAKNDDPVKAVSTGSETEK